MKTLKMLEILIALSIATAMMIPVFTIAHAVPIDPINPNIVPDPLVNPIWWDNGAPTGLQTLATLGWNPEFLLAHADTLIDSDTTIHITGLDQYGAMIEAKAFFPVNSTSQTEVPFVDPHSGAPVAFSKITGIFQQNGTHCNHIEVKTSPYPFEQYLGEYENSTGYWIPTHKYITQLNAIPPYQAYKLQDTPIEPVNPEPIKILINWNPNYFNATVPITQPSSTGEWASVGSKGNQTIWIEGLDEAGDKLVIHVNIPDGAKWVDVNGSSSPDLGLHTFSTICKVWGGSASGDSYYILTEPMGQRNLFEYYIRIHHLVLYPTSYDILANPAVDPLDATNYPGVTNLTLVFVDMDGHIVHASKNFDPYPGAPTGPVVINWWTSGGKITPSYSLIPPGGYYVTVNLTADTNPRTIKVVADANVPTHQVLMPNGYLPSPAQNLQVWTNIVFDGINSAFNDSLPSITPLQWGYTTMDGVAHGPFNAPPEPPLPTVLGGPAAYSLVPPFKLNGPIYEVSIPLYPGCNLISSPVYLIFGNKEAYYSGAYGGAGIPMDLLFNMTSASETIEAIWWYSNGTWYHFIPGVTNPANTSMFVDGVGYWIKAEKYCTLELSGVQMENAPFVPAEYKFYPSWNLMGITSIHEIPTKNYFEGVSGGFTSVDYPPTNIEGTSNAGPVWVFSAKYQDWVRDPVTLWPTTAMWVYNKSKDTLTLAP